MMKSSHRIELHPDDSITLLRKGDIARRLGVTIWTLDRWVRANQFPKPIYLQPGSPARWRARDIEAFIEKRRVTRRPRPKLRGAALKHGSRDEARAGRLPKRFHRLSPKSTRSLKVSAAK
jgi:predicted DNA-binding transcriptional regulator AlpA